MEILRFPGLLQVLCLYPELREALEEVLAGQGPDQIAFGEGFSYSTSFYPCNNGAWGRGVPLFFSALKNPEAQ